MIKSFSFKDFKSFEQATLYIEDITTLIGTNASGKSNAIEGIRILSEIASGLDFSVILDGSKSINTGIRGGSKGCCRFDSNSFELGCAMTFDKGRELNYMICINVNDRTYVLKEALFLNELKIFETKTPPSEDSGDIKVSYSNGKKGMDPDLTCIRSSSILAQMKSKMPSETKTLKENLKYIEFAINHLKNIFFLDPVPPEMRGYVRKTDYELKQNGENISAVLMQLCQSADSKARFLSMIQKLPENEIVDVSFVETGIGDVIFVLTEKYGKGKEAVDAKRLSDGTLRCISIIAAVITGYENSMLVIEEIDNGIHPSRAQKLIKSISEICIERRIDMIFTTHNCTLLNGLSKEQVSGISVAYRNEESGASEFMQFEDIPMYHLLLTGGGIGDSVANDSLTDAIKNPVMYCKSTNWLEGIG